MMHGRCLCDTVAGNLVTSTEIYLRTRAGPQLTIIQERGREETHQAETGKLPKSGLELTHVWFGMYVALEVEGEMP